MFMMASSGWRFPNGHLVVVPLPIMCKLQRSISFSSKLKPCVFAGRCKQKAKSAFLKVYLGFFLLSWLVFLEDKLNKSTLAQSRVCV